MTAKSPQPAASNPVLGLLAQYSSPGALVAAARECRERGYRQLEAFSPFPVHGLDDALGAHPTRLPWAVLLVAIAGGLGALLLQWWTNAIDYPFLISGKPRFSLPANIPVIFEVVILSAALVSFFGMLAANRLPTLANRLLREPQFLRATTDRFFLLVPGGEDENTLQQARRLLQETGATHVELLRADASDERVPRAWKMALAALMALALIPPAWAASARYAPKSKPRWHNFLNMDQQPKFKAQSPSRLFADGRSSRLPVEGTIARGQWHNDPAFLEGIEPDAPAPQADADRTLTQPVAEVAAEVADPAAATTDPAAPASDPAIAPAPAPTEPAATPEAAPAVTPTVAPTAEPAVPEPNWVKRFPLPVTEELMKRGRQRYEVYCAVCHGLTGAGNGLTALRAMELQQPTWVPPTSLHSEPVLQQPVGQLFHAISYGVRKMPAYRYQIPPEDRWAIVLYVRALQRSQNATLSDVPQELQSSLRETN